MEKIMKHKLNIVFLLALLATNINAMQAIDVKPASGVILSKGDQMFVRGVPVSCEAPLLTEGKYTTTCETLRNNHLEEINIEFVANINSSSEELRQKGYEFLKSTGLDLDKDTFWCDPYIHGPQVI